MAAIRLLAVREDDRWNYRTAWRVRSQHVGSILLWAHRAGATSVEYQPDRREPLQYRDAQRNSVTSEFAQPPAQLREKIIPLVFLDTLDGHPLVRPIRRAMRRIFQLQAKGTFSVPDDENQIESIWLMVVYSRSATFQFTGTRQFSARQKRDSNETTVRRKSCLCSRRIGPYRLRQVVKNEWSPERA